eukprot:TRINITY_DN78821_c0_g1_i1.p1 TRINITY_DN78821_c0_g1~~TRINITY_DN78821_c0_g1_i1.p1  ORF type:complete len:722 (-),score=104.74 TRINITY_DN78821_c0_g1_i1:79-2178(-)
MAVIAVVGWLQLASISAASTVCLNAECTMSRSLLQFASEQCKSTCYDRDDAIKLDKCVQSRCAACCECRGTCEGAAATASEAAAMLTTTETISSGECQTSCYDREGVIKLDKCGQSRCAACCDCAGSCASRASTTTSVTAGTTTTSFVAVDASYTLISGQEFLANLSSAVRGCNFSMSSAPAGLSIAKRTGVLTWQPDITQAGEYVVKVLQDCTSQRASRTIGFNVTAQGSNPHGIYVWPDGVSDGDGSIAFPLTSIESALNSASPGDTVYIRGGRYRVSKNIEITVKASANNPVTISRLAGERVHFLVSSTKGFNVMEGAEGVKFSGLELDGEADYNDHWEVIKNDFWKVNDTVVGGDIAFQVDGYHVTVENCVIHDFNQKGVNVYQGRYATVRYNVIYNIGWASLSGGHGIMRKWDINFGKDDPSYYRFDFMGNLLFAVEQRIYSFISTKGYCHMVLDEGKSILIDESTDKDMKARIAHNLVLYGGVDHIKLKYNTNLEVLNNAVMPEENRTDPNPDGITAVNSKKIPMTFKYNLAYTYPGSFAIDVSKHFDEADSPELVDRNYYSGGGAVRSMLPGISKVPSVFRDASNLDFRSSPDLPGGVGVDEDILTRLFDVVSDYGIKVEPTGWRHDHVAMTQAIVDAAPTEHLEAPTVGKSKHDKDHMALWFNVKSKYYKDLCNCNKVELIPPDEYWQSVN